MRFKIRNTEVVISFTFFGILIIFMTVGQFNVCLYSLIVSIFHELIHVIFIILFKGEFSVIKLSCFGADIKRNDKLILNNYKEAIISYSAPVANLIIALLSYFLLNKLTLFSKVNLVTGLFNLMPFFNFDGGRGLEHLLKGFLGERVVFCVLNILSCIVVVIFSFVSVYIFFNKSKNIALLILSIYMIFSLIFNLKKDRSKY